MAHTAGHRQLRAVVGADVQVQKKALLPGDAVVGHGGPQQNLAAVQPLGDIVRFPAQKQGDKIVVFQQDLGRDLQSLRQLAKNGHGGVGLSPLDLAEHAAGHPGQRRRPLQAQFFALSDALDILRHSAVQLHGNAVLSVRFPI